MSEVELALELRKLVGELSNTTSANLTEAFSKLTTKIVKCAQDAKNIKAKAVAERKTVDDFATTLGEIKSLLDVRPSDAANADLQATLKTLTELVTEMQSKKASLDAEAASFGQPSKEDLQDRIVKLDQTNTDNAAKISTLESTNNDLREQTGQLKEKIETASKAMEQDKEKAEQLVEKTKQLEEAQKEMKSVQATAKKWEDKVTEQAGMVDGAGQKEREAKEKLEATQRDKSEADRQVEELRSKVKTLEEKAQTTSDWKAKAEMVQQQLGNANTSKAEAERKVTAAETLKEQAEKDRDEAKGKLAAWESEKAAAQQAKGTAEQAQTGQTDEIERLKQAKELLETEKDKADGKITELEGEMKGLNKEKTDAEKKAAKLEGEVERLEEAKAEAKAAADSNVTRLETDKKAVEKEKVDAEKKVADLESEKNAVAKEKVDAEKKIADLEFEKNAVAKEKADAEKKVADLESEKNAVAEQKVDAEKKVADLEREKNLVEQAKVAAEKKAAELEAAKTTSEPEQQQLKKDNERLQLEKNEAEEAKTKASEEVIRLTERVKLANEDREEARKETKQVQSKVDGLEGEKKAAKESQNAAYQSETATRLELANLQSAMEEANKNADSAEERMAVTADKNRTLLTEVARLSEQCRQLEERGEELRQDSAASALENIPSPAITSEDVQTVIYDAFTDWFGPAPDSESESLSGQVAALVRGVDMCLAGIASQRPGARMLNKSEIQDLITKFIASQSAPSLSGVPVATSKKTSTTQAAPNQSATSNPLQSGLPSDTTRDGPAGGNSDSSDKSTAESRVSREQSASSQREDDNDSSDDDDEAPPGASSLRADNNPFNSAESGKIPAFRSGPGAVPGFGDLAGGRDAQRDQARLGSPQKKATRQENESNAGQTMGAPDDQAGRDDNTSRGQASSFRRPEFQMAHRPISRGALNTPGGGVFRQPFATPGGGGFFRDTDTTGSRSSLPRPTQGTGGSPTRPPRRTTVQRRTILDRPGTSESQQKEKVPEKKQRLDLAGTAAPGGQSLQSSQPSLDLTRILEGAAPAPRMERDMSLSQPADIRGNFASNNPFFLQGGSTQRATRSSQVQPTPPATFPATSTEPLKPQPPAAPPTTDGTPPLRIDISTLQRRQNSVLCKGGPYKAGPTRIYTGSNFPALAAAYVSRVRNDKRYVSCFTRVSVDNKGWTTDKWSPDTSLPKAKCSYCSSKGKNKQCVVIVSDQSAYIIEPTVEDRNKQAVFDQENNAAAGGVVQGGAGGDTEEAEDDEEEMEEGGRGGRDSGDRSSESDIYGVSPRSRGL